jgi:hypothetical protein
MRKDILNKIFQRLHNRQDKNIRYPTNIHTISVYSMKISISDHLKSKLQKKFFIKQKIQ